MYFLKLLIFESSLRPAKKTGEVIRKITSKSKKKLRPFRNKFVLAVYVNKPKRGESEGEQSLAFKAKIGGKEETL